MRTGFTAVILTLVLLVLGGVGFVYSGIYNVAATDPHWQAVRSLLETAKTRSIRTHAAEIVAPPNLDDPAKVLMGTEHFAAHCAVCHGAPGVPKGEIAAGLYPQPPSLAAAAKMYGPAELFWILKHGIKMTGMPAWSSHSDDELWATVAFLRKLPAMTEQDYVKLLVGSMAGGGHSHGAMHDGAAGESHEHGDDHGPMSAPAPSGKP
jgi:mono/diheme cytochrome c family protein